MADVLRFVSPVLHPLGFAWFALLVGAVVCLARRQCLPGLTALAAAAVLWLIAQPPVATDLMGRLERPWLAHTIDQAPEADAVIVLGGGTKGSPSNFANLDFTPAADRLVTGIELARLGRAKVLVLGGDPPTPFPGVNPDSESIHQWLRRWNIAPFEVETLGPVTTTREEALGARSLVERHAWKSVLLVTSAYHMRRASNIFEKAGIAVHPVACDFQVPHGISKRRSWQVFPDRDAFTIFELWWHEQLSSVAHWILGHS